MCIRDRTDALVSIIPTSRGTFSAPIVGLFSVPLSLLFDPDLSLIHI